MLNDTNTEVQDTEVAETETVDDGIRPGPIMKKVIAAEEEARALAKAEALAKVRLAKREAEDEKHLAAVKEASGDTSDDAELVAYAKKILDKKGMLAERAGLGMRGLRKARNRKNSLPAGQYKKDDTKKAFDDAAFLIRLTVPIDIEMDKLVRLHLWVEAMRKLVPDVEKLSYYQAVSKFIPTLDFDPVELTGEIKPGWIGWLTTVVERQINGTPMTIRELDVEIENQKHSIEDAKEARRKPLTGQEEVEKAEKSAERKARMDKNASVAKMQDAIDKALDGGQVKAADVAEIAERVLKEHNQTMPIRGGFDPENCTKNDLQALAKTLFLAKRLGDMRALRSILDQMIPILEKDQDQSADHALIAKAG